MKELTNKRDIFLERYNKIYDLDNWLNIAEVNKYSAFRINTTQYTITEFISIIKTFAKESDFTIFDNIIFFENSIREKITHKIPLDMGFILNPSSFLPVLNLELSGRKKLLDMCAAPGIKSAQVEFIAHEIFADIEHTAVEMDQKRFFKMVVLLNNLLKNNPVKTINLDTRKLSNHDSFDTIMLDAPCSAEGELIQDKNYSRWSSKLINSYTNTQKALLAKAISLCRKDGQIIYSTCTLAPEENEEVVDWALKRFPIEVEEINIPEWGMFKPITKSGIPGWGIKTYDSRIEKTIRIVPNQIYEGFYLAKLRKID
ncbi:MAG: RsmB/NOP family class I SAM-dependent RNA methyltransferase, partial [bacterium]